MTSGSYNKGFSFNEEPSKMLGLQKSTTIMERLESLEATNFEQEKVMEQKQITIKQLNERVKSLLQEKEKLEGLLNQIDEAENHAEFEEYKENVESKYKEELRVETEVLRMKIDEMDHNSMQRNLEFEEKEKEIKKLEKQLDVKQEKIHNFEENYVSKVKFESLITELKDLKDKLSELETTLKFKDMKVKELDKKVDKLEESKKKEIENIKKKAEEKFSEGKRKWSESKKSLKEQLKELSLWKNQNLMGEKVDPDHL